MKPYLIASLDHVIFFDWLIRTYFGPPVIPAVITPVELFNVLNKCYLIDYVYSAINNTIYNQSFVVVFCLF